MTTTTRGSTSNHSDSHNGLIASISKVIPLPSVAAAKSGGLDNDDLLEHEDALEVAFAQEEEKFIDEEISSHDEDGSPIVDTEALEYRHLTVALVQSCVDQQQLTPKARNQSTAQRHESTSSPSSTSSDHRRYGLRPRNSVVKSLSTATTPALPPPPAPGSRKRGRPPSNQNVTATSISVPTHQRVTTAISTPTTIISQIPRALPPPVSTLVPNPLIPPPNFTPLLTSKPTTPPAPNVVAIGEPPATIAELPFLLPSNSVSTSRGRIFSIDIFDPGFDFSDMALDSLQGTDFGPQPQSQNLSGASQRKDSIGGGLTTNPSAASTFPVDLPAVVVSEGRNRAFSFEFFSFLDDPPTSSLFDGSTTITASIPADDAMPDPILSAADDDHHCYVDDDDGAFQLQRPRGESIIFDPVSFQDGGIHETNALAKVRSGSVASSSLSIESQGRADVNGVIPSVVTSASTTSISGCGDNNYHQHVPDVATSSVYATSAATTPCFSSSQQVFTLVPITTTSMAANTSAPSAGSAATTAAPSMLAATSPFPMELLNKDGRIGIYLPEARRARIARFHAKRKLRIWRKRIKYDCRKKLADSRPRIKGRFVKRSDLDDEE